MLLSRCARCARWAACRAAWRLLGAGSPLPGHTPAAPLLAAQDVLRGQLRALRLYISSGVVERMADFGPKSCRRVSELLGALDFVFAATTAACAPGGPATSTCQHVKGARVLPPGACTGAGSGRFSAKHPHAGSSP